MNLPRFFEVRPELPAPRLADVPGAARDATRTLAGALRPEASVAVTAGSRGISRIDEITGSVVAELQRLGAKPFIVPAMGSHGGGTAEGQAEVIAGYGIDEPRMGAPVRSSMDVEQLGQSDSACPAYFDRIALGADAVIVLNRVKPHTILRGEQGSGLVKMLAIGLGKHAAAQTIHNLGLERHVTPVARALLDRTPVIGGIGIVENGRGETAHIDTVMPGEFVERDRELLQVSRRYMPHLPVEPLDVLVVRRMGKDLSGAGIDPNIIGMHRRLGGEPDHDIGTIVVLDLTDESHGNAIGVGMADLITTRLRDKIDWQQTSVNALTSGFLHGMKLPWALPTDRDALETAVSQYDPATVRMAILDDTLHLTRVWLSESLLDEARALPNLTLASGTAPLPFGSDGTLALKRET
jgi:hypothetical protein